MSSYDDAHNSRIAVREQIRAMRGQWVVSIRDIPSNTDEFLGPYHSEDKADYVARRFNRDIAAVGAENVAEAIVHWVRPGSIDEDELRDELLRDLAEMGYRKRVKPS